MPDYLVLIVEDNLMNRKLARDLLGLRGFRTVEAGSVAEALAAARREAPDLVLMDIQLPDGDGVGALRVLRASPATAGLRIVALTAFAMVDDRDRYLGEGFDGYISKPIDIKTFPTQVREYCELQRAGV